MKAIRLLSVMILLLKLTPILAAPTDTLTGNFAIKFMPLAFFVDNTIYFGFEKFVAPKRSFQIDAGLLLWEGTDNSQKPVYLGEVLKGEYRFYSSEPKSTLRVWVGPQILVKGMYGNIDKVMDTGLNRLTMQPSEVHYVYSIERYEIAAHLKFGLEITGRSGFNLGFFLGIGARNITQQIHGDKAGDLNRFDKVELLPIDFHGEFYDPNYAVNFTRTYLSAQAGVSIGYIFR